MCTEQGRHVECLACRARGGLAFPFTRDAWTLSGLASHCWVTFKRDWLTLLLGMVVMGVPLMLLGGLQALVQVAWLGVEAAQHPFALKSVLVSSAFGFVLNVLALPMMVGFIELCLSALRGRTVSLATILAPYARFKVIATVVTAFSGLALVYNLVLSLFFADQTIQQFYSKAWIVGLVASPLLIYVGIGMGFTYAVLADDPQVGALEAVRRSWRVATGHRWSILGTWLVSGLAMMLGLVMCLLPALVAVPWACLLWAGCYLALATPTPARRPAA